MNEPFNRIETMVTPSMSIGVPVYVDDILGIGDRLTVIENTRIKEEKFKFIKKKSKYMVIKSGKDKEEKVNERIKDGEIEKTDEYKYLGNWINERNNVKRQIKEKKSKLEYMISEVKRAGNKELVGNNDARVQKLLYEKIIIPTLTYNLEIVRINEREYEEIERMQARCLSIYRVLRSTPYWGILNETGIQPLECIIIYKKMMSYHNIMTSDSKRMAKNILIEQKKFVFLLLDKIVFRKVE